MFRAFVLGSVSVGLALIGPAGATSYLVRPDGSGDFPTIQAAIDGAQGGDVIELVDGTFAGSGNRDLDYSGKGLTIRSQSGNAATCVIDCQGSSGEPHRGVYFHRGEGASSVLADVTITGGFAGIPESVGGGILCWGNSSPHITGCVLSGNEADSGGGLESYDSTPTLDDCVFSGNHATSGGGMAAIRGGPILRGCRFEENLATSGAGMLCNESAVSLANCRFEANTASMWGAGIRCMNCAPVAIGCIFAGNIGAALYCDDASPNLLFCTFWGNRGYFGGAIDLHGDSHMAVDMTIISHTEDGPAILCYAWTGSSATIRCCDLFGNEGGDWAYCIADQYGTEGNFSADPLFCDPQSGNFQLQEDSPCGPSGECGLIGAGAVGCEPTAAPVTTWGSIKAMFR